MVLLCGDASDDTSMHSDRIVDRSLILHIYCHILILII